MGNQISLRAGKAFSVELKYEGRGGALWSEAKRCTVLNLTSNSSNWYPWHLLGFLTPICGGFTLAQRHNSSGRTVNAFAEDDLLHKKGLLVQGADGKSPPVIDFSKAEIIFKQKATLELGRSFVVLQMCSFNFLVDNSFKVA
eukprot:XP_011665988.1 PREDICTED: uncharacterized protein LOC105439102 [Strongylocentrotus purpuratus]